LNYLWLEVRE
ncbi:hypothetical protein EE612_022499, partial [Oryza sativa]